MTENVPFVIPVKNQNYAMKQLLKRTESRFGDCIMHGQTPLNLTIATV